MAETKIQEAKSCFLDAHSCAPHRFEPMKCLTETHLAEKQKSLAANYANLALKTLGQSPRTLWVNIESLLRNICPIIDINNQ